jgi:hypothetical protein
MKFHPAILLFLCVRVVTGGYAQQLKINNSTCTGATVCLPGNQAQIAVDQASLTFDPNDGDPKRRFQAFWITGDGNYLQFSPEQDAASMSIDYNYNATGNYQAAAYFTGKYTNRKPPARAIINVPVTNMPTNTIQLSRFTDRLGKLGLGTDPLVDIFSNHAIRRKYLTTFVISWPANVQATGVYFFFNGYQNHETLEQRRLNNNLLRYSNVELPNYFSGKMDASKIKSTSVVSLRTGAIPGLNFDPNFVNSLYEKYNDVLYFPSETASISDMPRGFTENRYFPVLWTDSLALPEDTLLNFYVLITSNAPVSSSSAFFPSLDSMIRRLNPDLNAFTPLATELGVSGQGQPQYIQAVAEYQLPYLATFDPNQLTVENVQKLGEDDYEVTFRLEMCNKGRGDVFHEKVDIFFNSDFREFQALDFSPVNATLGTDLWAFGVDLTIPGVEILPDGQHEESSCGSIMFKAKTNCNGLRTLWKGSEKSGVSSCVVFDGAIGAIPECHGVTRIDSTQYHENGKCYCCRGEMSRPSPFVDECCDGIFLHILLIIILLLILFWWFFKRNEAA